MKKQVLLLLLLIPGLTFCDNVKEQTIFKTEQEMYEAVKKVADDYVYLFIRHEDFPMMKSETAPAYCCTQTSLGPAFVYLKKDRSSVAFIFTNEGRMFNNPTTYYSDTWKEWYNYYVKMNKRFLPKADIELDIDEPEFKLLKEIKKRQ